jgi:cold-inducible RNA-binding protein
MTNIFIANLDWEISSEDLKATFSAFGTVSYAHVVFDKVTKKSKGYGYVEMDDADQAIAAIQALKGLEVNGRTLDVKIASPKGNRPAPKSAEPQKKPFSRESKFQKPESGVAKRPRISGEKERFTGNPSAKRD